MYKSYALMGFQRKIIFLKTKQNRGHNGFYKSPLAFGRTSAGYRVFFHTRKRDVYNVIAEQWLLRKPMYESDNMGGKSKNRDTVMLLLYRFLLRKISKSNISFKLFD